MPTILTHALVASAMVQVAPSTKRPTRLWVAAVAVAVAPDLDTIGVWNGVDVESAWGHRGLTHSLLGALVLGFVATMCVRVGLSRRQRRQGSFGSDFLLLTLVAASHGLLDAFTAAPIGVAFLAPFDSARFLFPWQPIPAAPLSIGGFFTADGMRVLASEMLWIWLPTLLLVLFNAWRERRERLGTFLR